MTEQDKISSRSAVKDDFHAPWEKSFDKIMTPFEEFIHRQATSGLLLMAMAVAVLALVLANGPLYSAYQHTVHINGDALTQCAIGVC